MSDPYSVFGYSKSEYLSILEKISGTPQNVLVQKSHIEYFDGYLQAIKTKTVLVEYNYIDKDYLEDYASYYVRNFHEYGKICTRLHFFKNNFDNKTFNDLLQNEPKGLTLKDLQDNYLGFMVIKPLPQTIFGKTCLKPYNDKPERHFCVNREYKINLFGIELTIDSLAYQEQDSVVAACASIALWTAFQKTGVIYQHTIPSPVEITKSATLHSSNRGRYFPMKDGLTPEQIAQSIRNVGLEPFCSDGGDEESLKCNLYAYLRGKIPAILGIYLYDETRLNRIYAGHAVTVTGFCLGHTFPSKFAGNDLLLTSSRINKIYVHDDGLGAYACVPFQNEKINFLDPNNIIHNYEFTLPTEYFNSGGVKGKVRAIPKMIIFPLYHKIRIPYNAILFVIQRFNSFLKMIPSNIIPAPGLDLEWDIFLCDVKDLKKEIYNNPLIKKDYKGNLLTEKLPRFIWRTIAKINEKIKFEFLFDATDIEQGKICLKYIEYDEKYTSSIINTIALNFPLDAIDDIQVKAVFEKIRDSNP